MIRLRRVSDPFIRNTRTEKEEASDLTLEWDDGDSLANDLTIEGNVFGGESGSLEDEVGAELRLATQRRLQLLHVQHFQERQDEGVAVQVGLLVCVTGPDVHARSDGQRVVPVLRPRRLSDRPLTRDRNHETLVPAVAARLATRDSDPLRLELVHVSLRVSDSDVQIHGVLVVAVNDRYSCQSKVDGVSIIRVKVRSIIAHKRLMLSLISGRKRGD